MTLLIGLIVSGVLVALAGTLGLAGLQRWGMILFVPVFAGFFALLIGGTATAMMMLVDWIGGTEARSLYSAADFWSAVLLLAYGLAAIVTLAGFRKEFTGAPEPARDMPVVQPEPGPDERDRL